MLEDHLRAELNCNSTHSANWISKIRSLMEELPILSQGGKTLELKMQLQLLKGYIEAVLRLNQSNNNNNNSGSSKTDNRKELTISSSTFSFQPLIRKYIILRAEIIFDKSLTYKWLSLNRILSHRTHGGGCFGYLSTDETPASQR